MNISQAFDLYCSDYVKANGGSLKTEESYHHTSRVLIDHFGDVALSSLSFDDIRAWRLHLSTWLAPDTVRGHVVNLRCVLRMRKMAGHTVLSPDTIRVPKRQKRSIHYLTPDEVDDFIAVLGRRTRGYDSSCRLRNIAIGCVLASSGIRVSELCALNRNSIRDRKFTVIGKSAEARLCFIDTRAEEAITAYLKTRNDSHKALFLTGYGNRIKPNNVRLIYSTACQNSDFDKITPHTKRHSLATTLLDRNVELCYIADILGHQSLDTTRMYIHYSNKKLQQIYDNVML